MSSIRPRLLEWQWSDCASKHRNRTNLLLHIVAVPLFDVATIALLVAVVGRHPGFAVLAVAAMVAAVMMEGRGHRKERSAVTFPRFVVSGGWFRHLGHPLTGG